MLLYRHCSEGAPHSNGFTLIGWLTPKVKMVFGPRFDTDARQYLAMDALELLHAYRRL